MSRQRSIPVPRPLSCELRSYTAWLGSTASTAAFIFGYLPDRLFVTILFGSIVLGLSSYRTKPVPGE